VVSLGNALIWSTTSSPPLKRSSKGAPDSGHPQFYGRRGGHKLRPGRQKLVEELLPRISLSFDNEPIELDPVFGADVQEVWLEVGFGGGEHLAEQARLNPKIGFIGCEPFLNGVASLLAQIDRHKLTNVRIFDDDARRLLPRLPEASIGRGFVLFADPWPKVRHHRRRFIEPDNLDALARVLKDGAELRFSSDHMGYVSWALEHVTRHSNFEWLARSIRDWRVTPDDWVQTRYESKALERGDACAYLRFSRKARADVPGVKQSKTPD
jgi:tRNA (guanine-N7-)-methyltransferase